MRDLQDQKMSNGASQTTPSEKPPRDWSIFFSSVFFVLGFSLIFSLVGVLLQTVLSNASYNVQEWLGRIGGVVIILFGFLLPEWMPHPRWDHSDPQQEY